MVALQFGQTVAIATTEAATGGGREAPQWRQNFFVGSTSAPHAQQRIFAGACGIVSPPPATLDSRPRPEAIIAVLLLLRIGGYWSKGDPPSQIASPCCVLTCPTPAISSASFD